jgi:hypothetical protein
MLNVRLGCSLGLSGILRSYTGNRKRKCPIKYSEVHRKVAWVHERGTKVMSQLDYPFCP